METKTLTAFDKKYGYLFDEEHVPYKTVEKVCDGLMKRHQDQINSYKKELTDALMKEYNNKNQNQKRIDQYLDAMNAFVAFENSRKSLFFFFKIDAYAEEHKTPFEEVLNLFEKTANFSSDIRTEIENLHNGPTELFMRSGDIVFQSCIDKYKLNDLIKYENGIFQINL